ncbi:MAG: T9SS type A sorting domain-containing protein, partial [Nitrososphaeraceae archaeon]|nr:T9SS type A sorting domain-containing protein [Nitrososphaeraceae archaeon]
LFSENFLVTYATGELWIDKASLTVSAYDEVINEGDNLPSFSADIYGFVFNEDFNSVFGDSVQIEYVVEPVYNGAAGIYQINPSLEEPTNYTIEGLEGILYVNPTLSGSRIKIHLECHEHLQNDPEGNTVRAYFSYENKDKAPWYIPEGKNNKIIGVDTYKGDLPTVFLPGKHIFTIEWDGSKMNWQLISNGRDKTNFASSENANSYGCSFADEYLSAGSYIYYPNPTNNYTNIQFTEGEIADATFTTYDSYGYPVSQSVYRDEASNKVTLDFNNLQVGLYHVFINHKGNTTSFRIQKD